MQIKQEPIIETSTSVEKPKTLDQLSEAELERKSAIGRVTTHTLNILTSEFLKRGFQWLLPVALSQCTDPLWPDPGASIEKRIEVDIYGKTVRTTASMIVHKLIASSTAYPKLFVLSPNIRLEKPERAHTGKHVYEFTQFDFEARNANSKDIFRLVEDAFSSLVSGLKRDRKEDLVYLSRFDSLRSLRKPFKVYEKEQLEAEYGSDWESAAAAEIKDPIWVTNIPREFYDFEDLETGKWDNYDLFLPQYGEALSGARREWEYKKIVKKMERDKIRKENYSVVLKFAKERKLKPSAGAGIGIERTVSWLTGVKHIAETQPFPRIPGTVHEL